MKLIQENGQPRYGRFDQIPSQINLDDYIYKTPYGQVLKGWRKQLKYKKFRFCGLQHEHYSIGVAIVDLSWAGHGFFYVYDHLSGKVIEWNAIQPLALKTHLDEQPLFSQSYFKKSAYQFDMQHANGVRYIQVTKHGEVQLKARIFCAGTDALSLCSPTGINGWTYTQKQTTLAVEGFFINPERQKVDFNAQSLAALDDTCGFLRPETAWFWLSCQFRDENGRRIGLNLASGVKGLPWFFGRRGILTAKRSQYSDWFKKDFHPNQHPIIRQYDVWIDTLAKTNDPIAAGEAFWQAGL